jgi:formylglycine-generating enzyme required for sulfatase activity
MPMRAESTNDVPPALSGVHASGSLSITASKVVTVDSIVPTLGVFTIPAKVYGSAPFAIKPPTSPSKGAWGYASSDPTVATVSGSQISIVGVGTTTITAMQAAAGNFLAASTTALFTVTPAVPKLGTFMIPTQKYGGSPITITPPTSSSPEAWRYTSSNPAVATVNGGKLTVMGAGSTVITATQGSSRNYASSSKQAIFKVTLGTPVLGPFFLPAQYLGSKSLTLTPPTSTSDGIWSFNCAKPSIAWVNGTNVILNGVGTATITAKQAATANWLAVTTNTFLIVVTNFTSTTDTFGSGSNQFSIDFVAIGNSGNSNDTTGYGGVPYEYRIGKYAISENQMDAAASNGLNGMRPGDWTGDQPASVMTWYQAAAFVNWLNTSKGYPPAYNLNFTNGVWSMELWSTTPERNGNVAWTNGGTNLYRNANCTYFLPSENEWYKAAYYDPKKNGFSGGYWLYPTGSDTAPTPVWYGTNSGTAVYDGRGGAPVFQAGGLSPYGTMGQGGNVWEWLESAYDGKNDSLEKTRVTRVGWGWYGEFYLDSSGRNASLPDGADRWLGFRVARRP